MAPAAITLGALARRVLRTAGVGAVYGAPFPGLPVVPAPAPEAALLAAAHRLVHGRAAATVDAGGVVRIGAPAAAPSVVTGAGDLVAAAPAVAAAARPGGTPVALRLDLDPAAATPAVAVPCPPAPERWADVGDGLVAALAAARRPVVLAGPGVVTEAAVPGLHAVAAAGQVGVLNTWGAKGVFDWRSRHHLATAGLQARDFVLGGLADADVIVAIGLDEREVRPESWRLAPVVEVPPRALDRLAERWSRSARDIPMPPLRTALAAVTQEGWRSTAAPLAPSRVTLAYGAVFGAGGLVSAAPGVAGYWVARTFATSVLGSVVVVPEDPALAVACAAVARLRDPARPVLAVVDEATEAAAGVQSVAQAQGAPVPVQVWRPDGEALDADALAAWLEEAAHADEPVTGTLATDPSQLTRMVEAAGEVTAWGGLGA